jgi:hypothetical protein
MCPEGRAEGFGAKIGVQQYHVGADQSRGKDGPDEAAPVAAQDADRVPRFNAPRAQLDSQ